MFFKQHLLYFVLAYVFLGLLVLTHIVVPKVRAQTVNNLSSETASYQGLQADEFMKTWLILGPIPVFDGEPNPQDQETQKKAFATDFLTKHGGEKGIQPKPGLTHRAGEKEYQWLLVHSKSDIVDLVEIYGKKEFVVAYAWAEIDMPEAKAALLGVGSDDGVKVWLNGELVHENWIGRPVQKDDDLVPANLKKGKNQLLLKVQNQQLDWGFACRVLGSEALEGKLISAAGRGSLDDLELLLSRGVNVNAKNKYGVTALHSAKMGGYEDTVKFLLSKGADPNVEMPSEEQLIEAIFKEVIKGASPGAAVLVAQNGNILFKTGYGYANLEHHVPITPETKFRIGSITKQFTAAAILQLQEQDKLSVNDKLSKFIPDYPRGDEVTIHHLLTHTSGIHSYTSKPDFLKTVTVEVKPEELIESFKNDKFDFNPGEKWLYNNSGYFLLGYIIEKVSGESYADYLKKHLFEPLSMNDTGVHHWSAILEHEAAGYSYENGKFQKALNWDMSRAGGAGALYSTVDDLYRWNEAVFNGKVLSESSLKAAFTPVTLNDGSKANALGDGGYGYGWMFSEIRGLKEIAHGGGLNGFSTYLTRYPEQNFTVVVLTNCLPPPPDPGSLNAQDIAQIYLWKQMKSRESFATNTAVESSVYDAYVGRYGYPQGAILMVTKEGDRLFAQLTGQPKFEIFPRSETEFFWKVVDAQITFVKNENGEVTHAIHRQGGQEFEAPKLKEEVPANVDPAVYDAYVGQYDYGQFGIATVTKEGDHLFAQLAGQPRFEIFPRSETEFFLKVVEAQVTFVKNDEGKVVKAILHQGSVEIEGTKIK
ncbi:DUF3471 domain-containing protein [Candidatus Poribacteria bacterium]|nr:DUF3471 domain-containing protein [Candidatus Poribacteria bacterium]